MTPTPDDPRDLLTMALVPGLGPRLTAALLAHFGSAAAVRRASAEELRQVPHIGTKTAQQFVQHLRTVNVDAELDLMRRHRVRLIALGSADYPPALTQIHDPPHLLYVRGTLEPVDRNAIAVIGTRTPTAYGRRVTEALAEGLARAGLTVVSGLARGIDGFAHRAALRAGGRTIAVLAGGLGRIYPPERGELAEDVEKRGALLAETPMSVEPQAGMFHARNRIVSGLARAVVVVEAAEKSGTLITVGHAAEQGREVFAIPGPVDAVSSAGTLALIRQGVKMIRGIDDLLEDLSGSAPIVPLVPPPPAKPRPARTLFSPPVAPPVAVPTPPVAPPPPGLDPVAQRVLDALTRPRQADELGRELGLTVPQLTQHLFMLEMSRFIRRLPGNQFERAT